MTTTINADNGVSSGSAGLKQTADNSGVLALQTNGTTALTLDASQNVGIGATSPVSKLQIGDNANNNTALTVVSANNTAAQVNLLGDLSGTYGTNLKYEGNGNYFAISLNNAGSLTEYMRVTSTGNVGINNTSPSSRLAVIGDSGSVSFDVRNPANSDLIYVWGNTGGSAGTAVYVMPIRTGSTATLQGGIYWNGSVLSLQGSSDYRLKENVEPLQNGLQKITQLNPVSYVWKESKNTGKGFIAHELQAVIPEAVVGEKDAVDEDGNIKPQSIDQTQIIVYLTKAIQELNAKVETQAAEIAALKAGK